MLFLSRCFMKLNATAIVTFLFLFGAFSFKEKSPTITVAIFFLFFRQTTEPSRMYHFLQKLIRLLRPSQANGNLVQRVPPFIFYLFYVTYKTGRDQRVPPFNFFRHYATFSRHFHYATLNFILFPVGKQVIFQSYRA